MPLQTAKITYQNVDRTATRSGPLLRAVPTPGSARRGPASLASECSAGAEPRMSLGAKNELSLCN
jgi:hypothetical protein